MSQQTEDNSIPSLNIGSISDIHYDEPKDFNKSIHQEVYKKAIDITREIIEDAKRDKSCKGGTHLRNKEQICNIIFFTGDKGTGKTSTMLSYVEFLKDYHRNTKKEDNILTKDFWLCDDGNVHFMFTGIEHIDASSLNDKEDILGDVLAKMLSKWKNEEQRGQGTDNGIVRGGDYEYKKRQLRLQFSEIYERLKELKNKEEIMQRDNDMFIEAIESLSFSGNVKKSFQKLVEGYLDIMVYPDSEGNISPENHYLVISIDDLDMNVQSGFLLLEQIRKYLMVSNVLVLMSANYEQLEKICYNYYWREFKEIGKNPDNEQYIQKISREYLEKMIPFQRQVELSSSKNWEYFSEKELIIKCPEINESLENDLNKPGTLCEIVSKCMIRCFHVKFGLAQRCISYLAPDTVREVTSWAYQINKLVGWNSVQEIDLSVYETNLRWFLRNEFPRLCRKYLTVELQTVMSDMETLNSTEQVKRVESVLCAKMKGKVNDNETWLKLLESAQTSDKQVRDFSYLCLIYFNVKLSDLTVRIQMNNKDELVRNSLLQYYNATEWGVWGSWEDEMITLRVNNDKNILKENDADLLWVDIARSHFMSDNQCLTWSLGSKLDARNQKDVKLYFEKNKDKILIYQYFLLFYNLKVTDSEEIFNFDEKEGTFELTTNCSGIFSLTGFVLNIMEGAPLLKQFQNMMIKKFKSYEISATDQQALCKKIFFIPKDDEMLLPVNNLDFLIYLGTQIQEGLGYHSQGVMDETNIMLHITNFFDIIIKCLDQYDSIMSEKFAKFGPVRKVMEHNEEFAGLLVKGIKDHSVSYIRSAEHKK